MSNVWQELGVRTDLAMEANELLRGATGREVPGVTEEKQTFPLGQITTVTITSPVGEQIMGKARGTYVTLEALVLRENNRQAHQEVAAALAGILQRMLAGLGLGPDGSVLLVGLGNWEATPDALGPRVMEKVLVTRHLHQYAPQELRGGLRPVSALAPGVLGITGIETADIIRGVVEKTHPDLVIAVDALAAGSLHRIITTIQVADTGISPGSGVGNNRHGITRESMGVPVVAIGMPTVVPAAVILQAGFSSLQQQVPGLHPQAMEQTARSVLEPFGGSLTVTPKEIDDLIENAARVIASALNTALHPAVPLQEMAMYLQ